MELALLAALNRERAARRPVIVVTDVASGRQRLVTSDTIAADPLGATLQQSLASGKSAVHDTQEGRIFLTVYLPPPRLVIAGAVHIAQFLAPMSQALGHDVTILDPRTAFASPERFPGVPIVAEWPAEALPKLSLDRYTAVVALAHNPEIDDPVLVKALAQNCYYVGALGSRRTHAKRVERLKQQGISADELGRIHGPVGLDIGAVTPAEIAVSIIGEITACLRRPGG